MHKVALMAVAVLVGGSAAQAANIDLDAGTPPAGAVPCHAALARDLGCAPRGVDANGDGTISAAELVGFASPAPPASDWTPLRPPRSTGLDFKDAAAEPALVLTAPLDNDHSRRLVPALFALGALVILLRKRPA